MQSPGHITFIIIIGTLLFISLASFIVLSLILYQRSRTRHIEKINEMENRFQKEKLRSQLEVQEQTMIHIAQELHDNIGQILSLAKIQVNRLKAESADQGKKLDETKELISKAIHDLRGLSRGLNTEHISRKPLPVSLRQEIDRLEKATGLETRLVIEGKEREVEPEARVIVHRMCQEILNNVARHAEAEKVKVLLEYSPEQFRLFFEDDGKGFDRDRLKPENMGTGLINLEHRAGLLGADLRICSEGGNGTRVELRIPYERQPKQENK